MTKQREKMSVGIEEVPSETYATLSPKEMETVEYFYGTFVAGEAAKKLKEDEKDAEAFNYTSYFPLGRYKDTLAAEYRIHNGILAAKSAPCNHWGQLWLPTPTERIEKANAERAEFKKQRAEAWAKHKETGEPLDGPPDALDFKGTVDEVAEFKRVRKLCDEAAVRAIKANKPYEEPKEFTAFADKMRDKRGADLEEMLTQTNPILEKVKAEYAANPNLWQGFKEGRDKHVAARLREMCGDWQGDIKDDITLFINATDD